MKIKLSYFFLEGISAGELIFVFLVVLLFFGSKSIPKMARTFGRAMRQIRDASQQIQDDIRNSTNDDISSSVIKKQETNTDD
jgi:sec-independent protein translocase protein TatA|tara:strand:+ start:1090 stop:1335 length:246 start_codon:yes stop_codon:yes gene_type:complete